MSVILHALLLDIPEVLLTERLTLQATRAGMGKGIEEAVAESHEAIALWMPWAKEPRSAETSERHCREMQAKWHAHEEMRQGVAAHHRLGDRRVAEKSGFEFEGTRRNARRDSSGEIADSCMYARIF